MGRSLRGRPYAGALDRLITVHRRASTRAIRSHALDGMLDVSSDRSRAIDYLRRVAESEDITAYDAVEVLIADANASGWGGVKTTPSQQLQTVFCTKGLGSKASRHRPSDTHAARDLDSEPPIRSSFGSASTASLSTPVDSTGVDRGDRGCHVE